MNDDDPPHEIELNDLLQMTAHIVASYVGNHRVEAAALPTLIHDVHHALATRPVASSGATEIAQSAVPVKKSVTQNYLVCLECGRRLKTLKRHLGSKHGLSPTEYREKWGLTSNYPMVTPQYSRARSAFAKEIGLGRPSRRR